MFFENVSFDYLKIYDLEKNKNSDRGDTKH